MTGMDDVITPGTLVDNCYEIQSLLGQGGFGRTYLSLNTKRFNEPCVLKEFVPQAMEDGLLQKSIELFRREAETLYRLEHPQIPRFLACFEENGRLFLVSEYVNGKTYQELLNDRLQKRQVFSEAEILHWLKAMLNVLDYIHNQNIVHRDIAPDNIMLPADKDLPVLIDFGVVKEALDGSFARGSRISGSSIVGKMGYASPEQMRAGQCSPSSDLYSLAATAVVLLTGRQPDELIDTYELEWRWDSYVKLHPNLAEVLRRMLADRPRDRYPSARNVLDVLNTAFAEPVSPRQASSTLVDRESDNDLSVDSPASAQVQPSQVSVFQEQAYQAAQLPAQLPASPPPKPINPQPSVPPADPSQIEALERAPYALQAFVREAVDIPTSSGSNTGESSNGSTTRHLLEKMLQLSQQRFSGVLDISSSVHSWTFFYCVGRFAWAINSYGSNRQFCRLLQTHANQPPSSLDLNGVVLSDPATYHIFLALSRRKPPLSVEKSITFVNAIVLENLFDVIQASHQFPLKAKANGESGIDKGSILMVALVRPEQVINEVGKAWKQWQSAGLANISPGHSPRIQYPDQLKQKVNANTYNTLQKVVDGQRTLQDIAMLMRQQLQPLTASLLPYLQQGLMTMNPVVDIAFPFFASPEEKIDIPLVACIDDSPQICQIMKVIVEREGYKFVEIRDSLRAVSILLSQKPSLVFLDLVMPVANGYEVCAQIRRVSALKKIPVVILTGNDGVVDRMRAKMVGATDFLSKPIDDTKVTKILQQYCPMARP